MYLSIYLNISKVIASKNEYLKFPKFGSQRCHEQYKNAEKNRGPLRALLHNMDGLFSIYLTTRLHENEKPAFSNSSGLKSIFEKFRLRDGLVWMAS